MSKVSMTNFLEQRRDTLFNKINHIEQRIEKLESFPDQEEMVERTFSSEDCGCTIIYFKKRFQEGGQVYSYAVIYAGGLWYSTGPRAPKGYTWPEMVDFLSSGVSEIWLVTELEQVY